MAGTDDGDSPDIIVFRESPLVQYLTSLKKEEFACSVVPEESLVASRVQCPTATASFAEKRGHCKRLSVSVVDSVGGFERVASEREKRSFLVHCSSVIDHARRCCGLRGRLSRHSTSHSQHPPPYQSSIVPCGVDTAIVIVVAAMLSCLPTHMAFASIIRRAAAIVFVIVFGNVLGRCLCPRVLHWQLVRFCYDLRDFLATASELAVFVNELTPSVRTQAAGVQPPYHASCPPDSRQTSLLRTAVALKRLYTAIETDGSVAPHCVELDDAERESVLRAGHSLIQKGVTRLEASADGFLGRLTSECLLADQQNTPIHHVVFWHVVRWEDVSDGVWLLYHIMWRKLRPLGMLVRTETDALARILLTLWILQEPKLQRSSCSFASSPTLPQRLFSLLRRAVPFEPDVLPLPSGPRLPSSCSLSRLLCQMYPRHIEGSPSPRDCQDALVHANFLMGHSLATLRSSDPIRALIASWATKPCDRKTLDTARSCIEEIISDLTTALTHLRAFSATLATFRAQSDHPSQPDPTRRESVSETPDEKLLSSLAPETNNDVPQQSDVAAYHIFSADGNPSGVADQKESGPLSVDVQNALLAMKELKSILAQPPEDPVTFATKSAPCVVHHVHDISPEGIVVKQEVLDRREDVKNALGLTEDQTRATNDDTETRSTQERFKHVSPFRVPPTLTQVTLSDLAAFLPKKPTVEEYYVGSGENSSVSADEEEWLEREVALS